MSMIGLAHRGYDAGAGWVRRHVPRRETIHRYRLLRPFAKQLSQPNLWRLNHRSVPRAVAVGLGVGIIIPFMHTIIAAIVALPARANIAVAAATTIVVNPLTIGPIYWLALKIGRWELRRGSSVDASAAAQVSGEVTRFLFWLHHESAPLAMGVLTLAAAMALIGYVVTAFIWRRMVHGQRRRQQLERAGSTR